MSTIRLHLEGEEWEPLHRYAKEIGEPLELIAYTALNRLMLQQNDPDVLRDIHETRQWRKRTLPLWADPAQEIHAYEGD